MNRLTTFAAVIAVLSGVLFCGCASPRVDWLGNPVIQRDEGGYLSRPGISSHEIGLRADGVVVWKRVK